MRPVGHGAVGSSCSDTSSTNKQNLDPATLTSATFCTSTFSPYTNIHVWGYQFDNYTDFQTGVSKLNSWTGYTGGGSLNTTCPPGSSARGRTEWWALHNAMYTSHRQDQFLECFTDHVKSAGNAGRAFLIWTLPTQDVVFIAENTVGNTSTNFTYLVNWWKHVAYA
jgi:hypothetical protein